MMLDMATVFASVAGALVIFGLLRAYSMWRSWSNTQKENDEIEMDKMIAEAIKVGNVELIAKLRKYFLAYKKR
jgi:hypothetical protein